MTRASLLALPAFAILAACGAQDQPSNSVEDVEAATTQMDPAAAEAVEQAIDNGATPQEALAAGGNAQAATVSTPQAPADSAKGAKPHAPGDPVPPPQVNSQTR